MFCWQLFVKLGVVFAMLFAVLAMSWESWSEVKVDVVEMAQSPCLGNDCCFVLGSEAPTSTEVATALQSSLGIIIAAFSIIVMPTSSFQYPGLPVNGSLVQIFGQTTGVNMRITGSVHSGLISVVDNNGHSWLAKPLPPPTPTDTIHVTLDLGLFKECMTYNFEIPAFTTRLDSTICVPKSDICGLVDSDLTSKLFQAHADAEAVQGSIDAVCRKLSAGAALGILTTIFIFPLVLLFVFPVTTHLTACLSSPIFHTVLAALAAITSLCTIAVISSTKPNFSSLESELLSQMQLMQDSSYFLQNLRVEVGYSLGFEIATLIVMTLVVLGALVLRLRKSDVALRTCGGFNEQQADDERLAKIMQPNDDDGDDDAPL